MCEKGKVAVKKCYGLTICIPPFTMLPRGGVRGIRNEVKHGKAGRRDVAPKLSCSHYPNIFLLAIKYWHFL